SSPTRTARTHTTEQNIVRGQHHRVSNMVESPHAAPPRIQLTENEDRLFRLLAECAKEISSENHGAPPVTLRVAGGWVRDKLLGKESDDIDIAIDTMKGEPFAQRVNEHMKAQGFAMGHIATIQVNPEKSKHLETANARVFDYLVDFVHLRTETYNDDSRNPEVVGSKKRFRSFLSSSGTTPTDILLIRKQDFGTPLEDALRRDITINALFYNIHTHQIEDFLGKGLDDLARGHVRTPLPAQQTFIDDPLRVLRVIRFATRFGYTIDEDILATVKHPDVQRAFERKITRERIGVEINKMLKGPDPVRALQIIDDFGYYGLVFAAPAGTEVPIERYLVLTYAQIVERFLSSEVASHMFPPAGGLHLDADDRRLLYLTASTVPFRGHTFLDQKQKVHRLSREIVLTSLKMGGYEADSSSTILEATIMVRELVARLKSDPASVDRRAMALLIRELGKVPLHNKWYLAIIFALVSELAERTPLTAMPPCETAGRTVHKLMLDDVARPYVTFMDTVRHLRLEDVQDFRADLNGKEVAGILGIRPGTEIGHYLKEVTEWQLGNPTATKEDCTAWLKAYAIERPPLPQPTKKRKSK
ncbi:CCA tRNA nucleotidyltransferase, mitochondrial, partial [Thoreauomyces humboldtii]